ncbi:MAG: hybrid sensor histidine kinase/response regulator [Ignavibacteria bacterium]|nr:hybrid sensor histidine kinase/response regulator [Ignavibacteria bacterium]
MIDSTLKNANILIVDDQQANIDVLTGLLDAKGFTNYTTTEDPRVATTLFEKFKPDLLLLDLMMPHVTGFQVMEQLKLMIPANTYFPILILTADITPESKQKALAEGATDFLTKPFDLIEVDLRIKNLLHARYLHQQIENQNQILEEKVKVRTEELQKTNEELIIAKEKAEESDKLKSDFLHQMSHEIRTPLNAIVGNADYINISIGALLDADTRECFESIDQASKRIIRTVDLILNAADLQTGGYKPNLAEVDLNSGILYKLYLEYQLPAKQKGLKFSYTCKEKETMITIDEYSVTQIFANLIDNAVKFTKDGKIEMLLGKNKMGNIMVEIKDTGVGISKEFLPSMFNPFTQEEQGFTRSYEGNGLGLTLVKKYCELNNITLEIESEKNVGSLFRIIFEKKVMRTQKINQLFRSEDNVTVNNLIENNFINE